MFVSNVTPSVIVAGAAGLAFGGPEQVYLIQMAMLFAGVATLFQTVGMGQLGARLPIMVEPALPLLAFWRVWLQPRTWGGAHRLCHSWDYSLCTRLCDQLPSRHLSPLVTGLVILAIGLYLMPVGIKYAAGGAAKFRWKQKALALSSIGQSL